MTYDIVITLRFGQSAGKESKNDSPTTTARVSVDDSLLNLNLLKIQSSPLCE